MKPNFISIILPVFNSEKFLSKAIDSIINQTYQHFELIIINDGSTDNSLEIISNYIKKDSRIRLINRPNKGLIYSLNEGIALSKGDYIARMDADDISHKDRLKLQLKLMQKKSLDICGCNLFIIDDKDHILKKKTVPKTPQEILITLIFDVPFAHPSVLIKKEFLTNNKLNYNSGKFIVAEDLCLWHLMFKNNAKFGNVDEYLFSYRHYANSLSKINNRKIKKESNEMFKEFINENKRELIKAFEYLLKNNIKTKESQIMAIRGSIQYLFITFNSKYYFIFITKVKLINTIIGTLSFIRYKFFFEIYMTSLILLIFLLGVIWTQLIL